MLVIPNSESSWQHIFFFLLYSSLTERRTGSTLQIRNPKNQSKKWFQKSTALCNVSSLRTKQHKRRLGTYTRTLGSVLSRITRPPDLDVRDYEVPRGRQYYGFWIWKMYVGNLLNLSFCGRTSGTDWTGFRVNLCAYCLWMFGNSFKWFLLGIWDYLIWILIVVVSL